MKKAIISLDIGGSSIKAGLIDKKGNILLSFSEKTKQAKKELLEQIVNIISVLSENSEYKIKRIGIGYAGTIQNNRIVYSPNLAIKNFDLCYYLKKRFNFKVRIDNDAHCAAIAEKTFGLAKNYKNFVMLTIGTGIGSAIFINNVLYRGSQDNKGIASELGHMIIIPQGKQCRCGSRGCFEQYASASALKALSRQKLGKELSLKELLNLSNKKNEASKKAVFIMKESGFYLGIGLINIANLLNPEAIILAGGMLQENKKHNLVLEEAIKTFRAKSLKPVRNTPIKISELKNPGIIGASLL